MKLTFLLAAVFVLGCTPAFGQYQILYNFPAGSAPTGGLVSDEAGNLYGTTSGGGVAGCTGGTCGTVFELSPTGSSWTESKLYSFCSGDPSCPDGWLPLAGLAIDSHGNLFGTTQKGGNSQCQDGCGVAFELSPPGAPGGAWTYTTLYTFCSATNCTDGSTPGWGSLTLRRGSLYGTTTQGGAVGGGIVFELSPGADGWSETTLYNFCSARLNRKCLDGNAPQSSVTFDRNGNLYGSTMLGGAYSREFPDGVGLVFSLSNRGGAWVENIVYSFHLTGDTGAFPTAPVTPYRDGVFTTVSSSSGFGFPSFAYSDEGSFRGIFLATGTCNSGVLFDVKRRALYFYTSGSIYQIHDHRFTEISNVGAIGYGNLIEDAAGNLYGVSSVGGTFGGGVVFEVTP